MINFNNDWSHKQCNNNICWAFGYSPHLTLSFLVVNSVHADVWVNTGMADVRLYV